MNSAAQQKLANQVVIITGASSGIGLATATAFHRAGARVVMSARDPGRLRQAAEPLRGSPGPDPLLLPCNVADRAQVDRLVAETIRHFGRVDILVNNAGIGMIAPLDATPPADAAALMATNFLGAFHCSQAVLPHMKERRAGHILNIASVAGLRGIPNSSLYSASKAALIAFSDAIRIELAPFGIRVSVLCPNRVKDTAFFNNAKRYGSLGLYHIRVTLTADAVAAAVLKTAIRPKPIVVIPFVSRAANTLNKFAPSLVDRFLARNMPKPGPVSPVRP
ncbi:MAG: SDR family NAD(P)-dependent oxidoreductase [Verrucomicrobia bacterium]|nr:SDR family NAD(P)-dependent oxidoreductase [Verrucomicrobiota bacterium]